MGSANHHSVVVADGEDEWKYVGREDGTNDIDGSFDEDGLMEIEDVKGSQMGLELSYMGNRMPTGILRRSSRMSTVRTGNTAK